MTNKQRHVMESAIDIYAEGYDDPKPNPELWYNCKFWGDMISNEFRVMVITLPEGHCPITLTIHHNGKDVIQICEQCDGEVHEVFNKNKE